VARGKFRLLLVETSGSENECEFEVIKSWVRGDWKWESRCESVPRVFGNGNLSELKWVDAN
jgi:hypothetical protein